MVTALQTAIEAEERIQQELSNQGLSDRTIQLQQELSDKFGIPTFDIEGLISTVPESGVFNEEIDVGTGIFTPEAFEKSKKKLVESQQNIISVTQRAFNEILFEPITAAFAEIFQTTDLEDLTDVQAAKVKAMDEEIARLEAEAQRVRDEAIKIKLCGFQSRNTPGCKAKKARKENLIKDSDTLLEFAANVRKEKNDFLSGIRSVRNFTALVIDRADELNAAIAKSPFTAVDKAELSNLIAQGSQLIEEILTAKVDLGQDTLSVLQVALQAAAFKLQEPAEVQANAIDTFLDGALDSLTGVGSFFVEGFEAIGKIFTDTMNELFDIDASKLLDAKSLADTFAQDAAKEAES